MALIGPRATGKSAVGRRLAELSGREFSDLDEVLAERYRAASEAPEPGGGLCAGDLLERLGEKAFRDLESEALKAIDERPERDRVLACGGGTLLREANRQRLREGWAVVYLRTPVEVLRRRLEREAEGSKRPPLLAGSASAAEEIERILAARESSYISASDFIVDCASADVESVALRIHELCPCLPRSTNRPPEAGGSA